MANSGIAPKDAAAQIELPRDLERGYQVFIVYGENAKQKIVKMRDSKANMIGSLLNIRGIVVRASDVKPQMKVATYNCESCGFEVYQVIHAKQFMPLIECAAPKCKSNNTRGSLNMIIRSCKFESYQDIKIQEPSD
jgi:DNA replication licensing factor MCM7